MGNNISNIYRFVARVIACASGSPSWDKLYQLPNYYLAF
jgi:hypothetical protein